MLAMNINSWISFRDRWTSEGIPQEWAQASVIFLQERRLSSQKACDDAVQWLDARGFLAVLAQAVTLDSGSCWLSRGTT